MKNARSHIFGLSAIAAVWAMLAVTYMITRSGRPGGLAPDVALYVICTSSTGALMSATATLVAGRLTERRAYMFQMVAFAVAAVFASLAHSLIDVPLQAALSPPPPAPGLWRPAWINFLYYIWVHLTAVGFCWSLRAMAVLYERERRVTALEATAAAAQLEALRLQLNPHFLFNALNSVSTLMLTGRVGEAERMLEKVCEFLRVTMVAKPSAVLTLETECEILRNYLDIEAVRFGERLKVEWTIDPAALQMQIPAFVLQPLVENAVKHGAALAEGVATVHISAQLAGDELILSVRDDARPSGRAKAGTGLGLENVRGRLTALYGSDGRLYVGRASDGGYEAKMRFPAKRAAGRPAARGLTHRQPAGLRP